MAQERRFPFEPIQASTELVLDVKSDVKAGQVIHRERTHGHSPLGECAIDLIDGNTFTG